jgi:prophage antirepressor-like protein
MDASNGVWRWLTRLDGNETFLADRASHPQLFCGSRAPSLTLISESGLYKLVLRSNKPEARQFQDWVTRDVLPAIRKDGAYIMGEEKVASGEMDEDEFVLKAISILQRKVERITAERDQARQEVVEAQPKIAVAKTLTSIERSLQDVASRSARLAPR